MGFGTDSPLAVSFLALGLMVVSLLSTGASAGVPCSGTGGKGSFKAVVGAACDSDFSAVVDSLEFFLVEASISFEDFSELPGTGVSDDVNSASCFFFAASCFSASSFLASAAALFFFISVIFSFISSSFLDTAVVVDFSLLVPVTAEDFFCGPLARVMRALALSAAASESAVASAASFFFAAADRVVIFLRGGVLVFSTAGCATVAGVCFFAATVFVAGFF
mmetsp:Transcript_19874/g.34210  ORF Transcript_19874/g.34210 Transcript_19874/m.34210 type:complete len:221 (+) Transcript_19874:699-1361(+)